MAKAKAKAKAKKATAKSKTKKPAAKKATKKVAKKPTAKKATKKVAKKPTAKKATKKVAKPAAKKVAKSKVAKLKTVATKGSVTAFLDALDGPRGAECKELVAMMQKATGVEPKMWGANIVGFGDWHYKYATGREGDFFQVGFSPRKAALTLYINRGYANHGDLLAKLGKHSTGKSCLYIKSLDDIDRDVLTQLVTRGAAEVAADRTSN